MGRRQGSPDPWDRGRRKVLISILEPVGRCDEQGGDDQNWFEISERRDWGALARYVADDYIWIDHTLGSVARTPDELLAATAEDGAWTDKRYAIDSAVEGVDGRMFVQLTVTQTLGTGSEWRGVKGSGQRVTWSMIDIFTFNDEGRVTVEEAYFDALSIMRQLDS